MNYYRSTSLLCFAILLISAESFRHNYGSRTTRCGSSLAASNEGSSNPISVKFSKAALIVVGSVLPFLLQINIDEIVQNPSNIILSTQVANADSTGKVCHAVLLPF